MTYCDGGDLQVIIDGYKKRRKIMKESLVLHYFVQILLGLQFMHSKKVLHRDIKAQNIFLLGNGRLVLGDLGISKVLANDKGFARTAIGTPYYMSPEIYKNNRYDYKSDIWALGCVLYELITLNHPFDATSMAALGHKVMSGRYNPINRTYSKNIRDIVATMLKVNPSQRPTTTQILQMPFIQKHTSEFIADIFTRESDKMGDGTKVIKQAIVGVAQAHGENVAMTHKLAVDIAQVSTLTNQIESLGLYETVRKRIEEVSSESSSVVPEKQAPVEQKEVKRIVQEQNRAIAREEEKKLIIQAALERLRKEKEDREKRNKELLARQQYRNRNPNRFKEAEERRNQINNQRAAAIQQRNQRLAEAQRRREQIERERERKNEENRQREEKKRADIERRIEMERQEHIRRQREEEENALKKLEERQARINEEKKREQRRISLPPRPQPVYNSQDEERDRYNNHLKVKEMEEQMNNQKYRNYREMGSSPSVDIPPIDSGRKSNYLPPVTQNIFKRDNALMQSPMNSRDMPATREREAARCESSKKNSNQNILNELERIREENIRANQEAQKRRMQDYRSDNIVAQLGLEPTVYYFYYNRELIYQNQIMIKHQLDQKHHHHQIHHQKIVQWKVLLHHQEDIVIVHHLKDKKIIWMIMLNLLHHQIYQL